MECDEYSNWRKNFSLFQLSPYLIRLITFLSEVILTFFSLHFIIVYILKYLWRKKRRITIHGRITLQFIKPSKDKKSFTIKCCFI